MNENSGRKLVASVWMSLDGIFDADSMPKWFEPFQSDERAAYIRDAVVAADAFVVGRVTGKRFFRDGMATSKLSLVENKPLGLGVTALRYSAVA